MNYKPQNKISSVARLFVLLLCIVFYSVQLFFNFDIANFSNNELLSYGSKIENKISLTAQFPNSEAQNKKPVVRLNKRFQPQSLPSCAVSVTIHETAFTNKVNIGYTVDHIPVSVPRSHSLRGPPVVC